MTLRDDDVPYVPVWTCPKCGNDSGVWIKVRVRGFRLYYIDGAGEMTFANDDDLEEGDQPKTGVCETCGERVKTPHNDR